MFKKLKSPAGQITNESRETDANDKVVRKAILVHAGPDGEAMVFHSGDGDIEFDDARIQRVVENQNQKVMALGRQYGGLEKMPLGAFAPILDQHSDASSKNVGGRLASLLKFERLDVPGVGKNVACATGDITFLGEDVVNRVKDGRIYHLSIGIDEDTDTLGEVSTVIEPAAPGAMLLKKRKGQKTKNLKKGDSMSLKMRRLQRHSDRMAKLSAIQKEFVTLNKTATGTKEMVKLTARKRSIVHRLSKLMAEFKLSPVEYKKIDLTKMAKMSDEAVDMVLDVYEARPKIESGQRGSTDAAEFGEIAKNLEKRQLKKLRAEIKGDFKRLGKKLVGEEDKDHGDTHEMSGPEEHEINPGKDEHSVEGQEGDEEQLAHLKHLHEKLSQHLADGDVEGAKETHEEMKAHMSKHGLSRMAADGVGVGDVKSEDEAKGFDDLQGQVDEIHTNMARLAGMVKELMDSEKEEGDDLKKGLKKEVEEDAGEEEEEPGEQAS